MIQARQLTSAFQPAWAPITSPSCTTKTNTTSRNTAKATGSPAAKASSSCVSSHPVNVAKLKAVLDDAATMLYTPTDTQLDAWQREMNDACTAHFGRALTTPAELDEWNSAGFHPEAKKVCPSVCAYMGAGILDVVANAVQTKPVPIVKAMEFLADGLFCEFAYVADLDAEALEVYSGRWGRPMERQGESRFRSVECLREERYLPPLIGRCVFSDLPDEDSFVEALR